MKSTTRTYNIVELKGHRMATPWKRDPFNLSGKLVMAFAKNDRGDVIQVWRPAKWRKKK